MNRQVICEFNRAKIVTLVEEGHTQADVAARVGVNQSDVSRIVKKFRETNSVHDRPKSGRPRITTDVQDRFITLTARRNRTATAPAIRRDFQHAHNIVICDQTIRNRLHVANLFTRRPLYVPKLTLEHKRNRLEWANEHLEWDENQWRNVLFSDETRIGLVSDSRRIRVWRNPNQQDRLEQALRRVPYQGGTIMFWGGIRANNKTHLIPINGNMNGQVYIDTILRPVVRLWKGAVGPEFVFMDDNAPPHRTRQVQDFLETEDVTRLRWPSNSPDLNPIEHAWDKLKRKARQQQPRTLQELRAAAVEEWDAIDKNYLSTLVGSMTHRINACVMARGGNTAY